MTRRVFSPPDSERILFSTSSPENWKAPSRLRSAPIDSSGKVLLDLLPHGELGIEELGRLLREVAHLHARPDADIAAIGRQRPRDHLEQRCLAGAVAAHDAPALAATDGEVDAVVNDALAVRLRQILENGNLIARTRGLAKVEVDDLALLRQLDLLNLVERLDAALHLRRLGRMRGEALDEALFLGQHRLLPRVRRLAVRFADAALALVKVVVSGVRW